MKRLANDLEPRATALTVTDAELTVQLSDGRSISVPLAFYPTLLEATPRQRQAWSLIGEGEGFTWAALDLDLSVRGIVEGVPERVVPPELRQRWKQAAAKLAARRGVRGQKPARGGAAVSASKRHAPAPKWKKAV